MFGFICYALLTISDVPFCNHALSALSAALMVLQAKDTDTAGLQILPMEQLVCIDSPTILELLYVQLHNTNKIEVASLVQTQLVFVQLVSASVFVDELLNFWSVWVKSKFLGWNSDTCNVMTFHSKKCNLYNEHHLLWCLRMMKAGLLDNDEIFL